MEYSASETQARESQSSELYRRLGCLKQSWSLCNIGRGGTGSSAFLIRQETVNRTNGFLRELGRNEMRSSYLYSCCKGLARIVKRFRLFLPFLKTSISIPLSNTDSPLNFKTTTTTSTSFALKEGNFGSLQDKAGPQNWYQRILDERTLDATDVKKSSRVSKRSF